MIAKSDYREQFVMAAPPELDDKRYSLDSMDIIELNDDGDVIISDDSLGHEDLQETDTPVYVCCFCLDEFGSHDEVNSHQNVCQMKVTSPQKKTMLSSSLKSVLSNENIPVKQSEHTPFPTNIFSVGRSASTNCSSSNNISSFKNILASTSSKPERSSERLKTRSQKRLDQIMDRHKSKLLMVKECKAMSKGVPESGAWWCKQKGKKPDLTKHPTMDYLKVDFTSVLGLAEKRLLKSSESMTKGTDIDLDCEITLVEGPLSKSPSKSSGPRNPMYSPRTKSLISQLSREPEEDVCRRVSLQFVEDEWADRENLEEGRDPLSVSLLTLDVCSPLGQRIKKFVKGEGVMNIIKDPEQFCKADEGLEGNNKLRFRSSDYKVTFRKKCRSQHFVHKYKFTKEQRIEFKKRVRAGLTARSRQLLRCVKPCKVVLKRISEAEIKSYSERKITIPDKIVYDDDVCITQIDLPESIVVKEKAREHMNSHPHLHQHMTAGRGHNPTRPIQRSVNPHMPNINRNYSGQRYPLSKPGSSQNHHRPLALSNVTKGFPPSPYLQRPHNGFPPYGSQHSQKENPLRGRHPPYRSDAARSSELLRNAMLSSTNPQNTPNSASRRKQQFTGVRLDEFDSLRDQKTKSGGALHIHSHQANAQIPIVEQVNNCSSNFRRNPSQNPSPRSQGNQLSSFSHRHQGIENNQHLNRSPQTFQQSPSQRLANFKSLLNNKQNSNSDPMPNLKTAPSSDDDVLEVICIDDD